jgi:polyferredoxin
MLKKIGTILVVSALLIFSLMPALDQYRLAEVATVVQNNYHRQAILEATAATALDRGIYNNALGFIFELKSALKNARNKLDQLAEAGLPPGVSEWDFRMGSWAEQEYLLQLTLKSGNGLVSQHPWLFFLLTAGLASLGGLLYIASTFGKLPGIRNDEVQRRPLTKGASSAVQKALLLTAIPLFLFYGYLYTGDWIWPAVSALACIAIVLLVRRNEPQKSLKTERASAIEVSGWLGIALGVYLIAFYVILYWAPHFAAPWIKMMEPLSLSLSGKPASQWFLYGFLYTIAVLVMGFRMLARYRHNRYQVMRTCSVMFFQTAFAFLIPEILVRLNQPYFDFKNIWPLNYSFFFDWNLDKLLGSGDLGIFMLVWGIALTLVAVPLMTWLFGKRWYCSWVCGCGGLAETLGDPFRHLSDKSLKAWHYERWIIHGVLVFAVVMTLLVLYTYFTGSDQVLFLSSDKVRTWYGFLIGASFAGVVGTGFYPIMGNRVWCRFGCPLAAYLGLVQRFNSRFRITVNNGLCISCGNCSTFCEMGIDVRHYAQRGQDVVRASCVGCGVCAAVCPRGVLRLENAAADIGTRTTKQRNELLGELQMPH